MSTFAIKTPDGYETLRCKSCNSLQWETRWNFKGIYGIWCASCGKFDRWLGKEKTKPNNTKFIKAHKKQADGERICCLCGITESLAKKMGWDFAADHIVAEDFGGADNLENSWPLCSPCHYIKTALEHHSRGVRRLMDGN